MKVRFSSLPGRRVLGEVEVPTNTPGTITAKAAGDDKHEALARASAIAARICDDPVMRAIMSPATRADLDELRMLATAAQEGPEAIRSVFPELGANKRKLAKHLMVVHVKRAADEDADGERDPDEPVDIVNGRGPEVSGFWDTVTDLAKKGGDIAWKQAMAHRKEIAMAAATAALGPAAGIAAGKAVDLLTAAQQGHPEAAKAVSQVATQADNGDPKAKLMATIIRKEIEVQKAAAANAASKADAQPDKHEDEPAHEDEHHDAEHEAPADNGGQVHDGDGDMDFHMMRQALDNGAG